MSLKSFVIAVITFSSTAMSQNGNSILSRFGIGDLSTLTTVRQRGFGHVSASAVSPHDISYSNPASWSYLQGVRLQGELSYEYETWSDTDLSYGNATIRGLSFALPLEEQYRLRMVTGFLPVSRVSYELQSAGAVNGEPYTAEYLGSGGLSLFRLGLAAEPIRSVRIGLGYHYYFGTIDQQQSVTFSNSAYYSTSQTVSLNHSGSGMQIGLMYDGIHPITIGASITTGTNLNTSQNLTMRYSTHDSTVVGAHGTRQLPFRVSIGAAYELGDHWNFVADYSRQDWTDAVSPDAKQNPLGLTYRIGGGVEWNPSSTQQPGFMNLAIFRIGFFYQSSYVRLENETQNEFFLTAGADVSLYSRNRATLALEFGRRGSSGPLLGPRSLFRFSFSLSVGEGWFIRQGTE